MLAATDGSVWIATHDGLTRWKDGQFTVFRKASGLPDDEAQSLYQDDRGRIWVSTKRGLAYFEDGRFVAVKACPAKKSIPSRGTRRATSGFQETRACRTCWKDGLVEHFPWSALGRRQQAKVIVSDQGGLWLSFWQDGGVLYFKDGQVRASYTAADGLGKGHVPGLQLDRDGALWAATEEGGLSRIKDGRISYAHEQEWSALRHDSLDDRGRRPFALVVHGLRPRSHHARRTGRVDRRPAAQD